MSAVTQNKKGTASTTSIDAENKRQASFFHHHGDNNQHRKKALSDQHKQHIEDDYSKPRKLICLIWSSIKHWIASIPI